MYTHGINHFVALTKHIMGCSKQISRINNNSHENYLLHCLKMPRLLL